MKTKLPLQETGGYIDKSEYGVWKLTKAGATVEMTDELASEIFRQGVFEMKEKRTQEANYQWVEYYSEFADVLLTYKNHRAELISKIREVFSLTNIKLPKLEMDRILIHLPFLRYSIKVLPLETE